MLFFSMLVLEQQRYQSKRISYKKEQSFCNAYLDGELSEEKIIELFWSIEELKNKYKGWKVIEQTKNHIVLHKMDNDISPLLKTNGYFGMTEDGNCLSIMENPRMIRLFILFPN